MIGLVALALAGAAPADPGPLMPCDPPPGWAAVAARNTRFVVFGEVHGTAQAPSLVGDVACALAFQGERLLVAVELDATSDVRLQQAWGLPDDRFAAALAAAWPAGRADGVGSRAMMDLLLRLHRLRAGGRVIDIVAFNGARDAAQAKRFAALPGQGAHEAEQADNIRAADAGRYDHVLVLTGDLHARRRPVTLDGATFEPMAMRLAPAAAVTTLDMADAGGTAWNCSLRPGAGVPSGGSVESDAITCGARSVRGSPDLRRRPFMALGAAPGRQADPAFDGYYWVGAITASLPARPR